MATYPPFPTYPFTTLQESVDGFEVSADQVYQIVNADDTTDIPAVNGDIPSFRKIQAQFLASGDASEIQKGIIEIATAAEASAGTDDLRAMTPAKISGLIGVTVQGYDADTAKTDLDQTWTGSQRGSLLIDNDLSFDMDASNNFKSTPTGTGTLTFTNIASGQSGFIWLDNSGGHVISAAATTFINSGDLSNISVAGVYALGYESDGTNVAVTVSSSLTSGGA